MFNHLSLCFYSKLRNTLYLFHGVFTKRGSSTTPLTRLDANSLKSNFICIYIVIHRSWLFQNPLVVNFILNKNYIEILSFLVVPPLLT